LGLNGYNQLIMLKNCDNGQFRNKMYCYEKPTHRSNPHIDQIKNKLGIFW